MKCRTPVVLPDVQLTRVRASFETNDENGEQDLDMCMNSYGAQQENTGMVGLTAVPNAAALIDKGLITMDIKYRNPEHIMGSIAGQIKYAFELNSATQAMKQIRQGYDELQKQGKLTDTQCSETF